VFALFSLIACSDHGGEHATETALEPALALTSPAVGDWMPAGAITAEGTLQDIAIVDVSVEGGDDAEADISSTSFTAELDLARGLNLVEASGVAENGDTYFQRHGVLAGEFGDADAPVEDALWIRVNQAGLDAVIEFAGDALDLTSLLGDMSSLNPLVEFTGLDWLWTWVAVDMATLTFGEPTMTATPHPGYLSMQIRLPELYVGLVAYGEILSIDYDTDVILEAREVILDADVFVDAQSGQLVVELGDVTTTLDGFSYDLGALPGDFVEDFLFVDTIRDTITDMLTEQITEMVPPLLEETLAGLDLSFEFDLMGTPLSIAASFADALIDEQGLQLVTDVDLSAPPSGDLAYQGFLLADYASPEVDRYAPFSLAMSDDMLNRLLFEVWRAGLLNISVTSEDEGLGDMLGLLFEMLHADTGSVAVAGHLPPVMVERDGGLLAQIGELMLTIETPGGELGETLTVSTTAQMPLALSMSGGCIELDLGDPELEMMARASDWGASNEALTHLLSEMLPLDTITGAIDLLLAQTELCDLVDLSSFGISLDSAELTRDEGGAHTLVAIEIGAAE